MTTFKNDINYLRFEQIQRMREDTRSFIYSTALN